MVAEVVRSLGYTENARILTNPATENLKGVASISAHFASKNSSDPLSVNLQARLPDCSVGCEKGSV